MHTYMKMALAFWKVRTQEMITRKQLVMLRFVNSLQAAVLLLLFGFGVLRHRVLKRRAMKKAVAAAVGDIPAPPSSESVDILPKTGLLFQVWSHAANVHTDESLRRCAAV